MSAGLIRSIRDLVIMVQFEEDCPEVGELLISGKENKAILLVNHLTTPNIAVYLNILGDRTLE